MSFSCSFGVATLTLQLDNFGGFVPVPWIIRYFVVCAFHCRSSGKHGEGSKFQKKGRNK